MKIGSPARPAPTIRAHPFDRPWLLVVLAAAIVGLAAVRLIAGGWEAISPDHARYLYAGMSLLDGRGYVNEAGDPFLFRSPAYPLIVGGAFTLAGATGAHLVAWSLGLTALILAIVMASRLGGWEAALGTSAAIVAVPLLWQEAVSLGIDLPQAALFLGTILLLGKATPARWIAAGALLGLTILVKETIAPAVVLLPIAWLPVWSGLPWRRWAGLFVTFTVAAGLVAGWWWLVVWRETGLVFPLNSLQAIVPNEDTRAVSLTPRLAVAGSVVLAAWVWVLWTRFREPGVRLIGLAALSLAPAAVAVAALAQPIRNLTVLVLLSCVVVGVAGADVMRWLLRRAPIAGRRAFVVAVTASLVVLAAVGQLAVGTPSPDAPSDEAAALIRPGLVPGDTVISSFRARSAFGVSLFDRHVSVRLLPIRAVVGPVDPSAYLWLGARRGTLFGLTRRDWQAVLGSPHARFLALVSPHSLTPAELLPVLRSADGRVGGLTLLETLRGPGGTADVFTIDPRHIDTAPLVALHAQPGALVRWLNLARAGGDGQAVEKLLEARPIVPEGDVGELADRLGPAACFRPQREAGRHVVLIEPRDAQADCLSESALHSK